MAVFNPTVAQGKDQMPSWLKQSSPISDITADKSTGVALSTLGNAIEGGATLIDTTMKDIIGKDVREQTEAVRSDFTKELEIAKAASLNSVVPAPAQGTKMSLAPEDAPKESIPASIDNGLRKVDAVQAALTNGKINDTYYDMRLNEAVTGLRSKYPGYVDYIDQKVSQITGRNPANSYINNLMQDINRAQSNKKTEFDKELDLARQAMSKGLQNADKMFETLQQRGEAFLPKFREWYTEENAKFTRLQYQEALRKSSKANKEDLTNQREADFTNEAGTAVSNNMNTILKLSGLDTPMSAADLLQDAANNPGKYKEEQMKEFATRLLAQRAELERQLLARASKTDKDDQGRTYSYNSDVGSSKTTEIIKNTLSYYDAMYKALWDGGAGGAGVAFYHAQRANAMLAGTRDKIYSGPAGEDVRTFNILNSELGPNWTSLVTNNMLRADVDQRLRPLFETRSVEARAQPDKTKPVTFKNVANEALGLEQNKQITAQLRARYLDNHVKLIDDVTDPQAPDLAKINVLKYFFSPEGQGTLSNFKDDYYSTEKMKNIPGRQTVWNKFTSDAVVSEVKKLSAKDPSIGMMYQRWIENEAGSQLFYKDFLKLNQVTGHDNLGIKYNDGGAGGIPRIELTDSKGQPLRGRPTIGGSAYNNLPPDKDPNYINMINQNIERINTALVGMHRVQKGLGTGDASEYLLRFLNTAQVDMGKNWTGLPAQMMDAIAASRGNAKLKDMFNQKGQK